MLLFFFFILLSSYIYELVSSLSLSLSSLVHCGSTRQTASIISMNKDHLRTGDKASCRFRFIKTPEYIHVGARMVFREGRTKAVGNITSVFPCTPGSGSGSAPVHTKITPSQFPNPARTGLGRSKGRRVRGGKGRHKHEREARPAFGTPVSMGVAGHTGTTGASSTTLSNVPN